MTKNDLLALATRRFKAVESANVDESMSVLIDDPVFDLFPIGLRLSGQENVRNYYSYFFDHAKHDFHSKPIDVFYADAAIGFELDITHAPSVGEPVIYRLFAIMPVEGDRFTGERLFGDERLFRLMFGGPTWSRLTAIRG